MKYKVVLVLSIILFGLSFVSSQEPTIYQNCEIYGNCLPEIVSITINASNVTANNTDFCGGIPCIDYALKSGANLPLTGTWDFGNQIITNVGDSDFNNNVIIDNRLGIGTLTPQFPLDVNGIVSISGGSARIQLNDTLVPNSEWWILPSTGGITSLFRIYDATQAIDRFVINENGDVGIGTTTPNSKLQVQGNVTAKNITLQDGKVIWERGTKSSSIEQDNWFLGFGGTTWDLDASAGGGNIGILRIITGGGSEYDFFDGSFSFNSLVEPVRYISRYNNTNVVLGDIPYQLTVQVTDSSPVSRDVAYIINEITDGCGVIPSDCGTKWGFFVQSEGINDGLGEPALELLPNRDAVFLGDVLIKENHFIKLTTDTASMIWGAASDVESIFDGTNFIIRLLVDSAPKFLLEGFSEYNFDNDTVIQGDLTVEGFLNTSIWHFPQGGNITGNESCLIFSSPPGTGISVLNLCEPGF